MSIPFFSSQPAWWPRARKLQLVHGDAPVAPAEDDPNVFVVVLALIGALVCTGLAGALMFSLFDYQFWMRNPAAYGVSAIGLVVAGVMLNRVRGVFATCFALVLWGLFIALFLLRLGRDVHGARLDTLVFCGFLVLTQVAGATIAHALWIKRIMGFVFAIALYIFVGACVGDSLLLLMLDLGGLLLAAVWWFWIRRESELLSRLTRQPALMGWTAFLDSAIVGLVLMLAYSAGGMLGGNFAYSIFGFGGVRVDGMSESTIQMVLKIGRAWSVLLTLLATGLLYAHWKRAQMASPQTLVTVALAGVLLAVAAWFAPSLGMLSLVAAIALIGARWRMAVICGLAALWALGQFYYNLSWPLAQKGLVLALLGALLLVGLFVQSRVMARKAAQDSGMAAADAFAPIAAWSRVRLLCLVAGAVLIFGLVNWDVRGKEHVIAEGRPVLVRLVPVDPRSLMQGDYMALRFDLPQTVREGLEKIITPIARVRAQLDDQGRATVKGLIADRYTPEAGEEILPLKQLKGKWVLVTDAYFFPEGTGKAFEQAKFGDFRVLPDGRALLVGLADADGKPIPVPRALPSEERGQRANDGLAAEEAASAVEAADEAAAAVEAAQAVEAVEPASFPASAR